MAGPAPSVCGDVGHCTLIANLDNLASVRAALAATLAQQRNLTDANPFIERLGHVIDRERRDAGRGHCFHLYAGACDRGCCCSDAHAAADDLSLHINETERQWVTHGDEFAGALRRLDPCKADRKSTRLNSSHFQVSRMPSSA